MAEFEFLFALFGLLLGLSLAEVLTGLARAIQARLDPDIDARIGWLTPLLGLFVFLDLLSFWGAAWASRDVVAIDGHVLLGVSSFAGAYFLAASLAFPRSIGPGDDLDLHFFRVRRVVIGVMLVLLACQIAFYAATPALAPLLQRPLALALAIVLVVLMTAAMLVRGERLARFAMLALVARYLLVYLL